MEVRRCGTAAAAERGFLYVEVLAALTILAFAVVAMAPLFLIAARENAAAGDQTLVTALAQDKAEALASQRYTTLAGGFDDLVLKSLHYERTWTVADNQPYNGMKTVTVSVRARRRAANPAAERKALVRFYRLPQ